MKRTVEFHQRAGTLDAAHIRVWDRDRQSAAWFRVVARATAARLPWWWMVATSSWISQSPGRSSVSTVRWPLCAEQLQTAEGREWTDDRNEDLSSLGFPTPFRSGLVQHGICLPIGDEAFDPPIAGWQ
ncbi:MAG: hypothetical protein M1818_006514 [Claussenomyces sp. TS43310]|nr:MAG: hypothetical protein M1818_006514 [Claussenomyces sp. TS43310]